jgi:hypothetical protein
MTVKKNSTSSTFSAESADSALDSNQPDLFGRSHSVNENHIAKPSCESTGPTSRSSTMSAPSTQMDLEELTSSSVASHASPGPKPGSSEAQKMTAISGRKWLGLLETYGLAGQFAKMCGALLTNQWASSAAFLTWKASATKPFHLLFQLAPSMPRTAEIESGSLHTPTSKANQFAPSMRERDAGSWWATPAAADSRGSTGGNQGKSLRTDVRMWPTPVARDHKGQGMSRERRETREPDNLCSWTKKHEGSGALNPEWVEWLMGFPLGWTNLTAEELQAVSKTKCRGSNPSATRSCQVSSRKSEEQYLKRNVRE